jgi:anti-sigma-K factor RskA
MHRTSDETLMRRYLLGDLPQEERGSIEDRYLADDEVFEALVATENDLIDAYARGGLADDERRKFEAEYLTILESQICARVELGLRVGSGCCY